MKFMLALVFGVVLCTSAPAKEKPHKLKHHSVVEKKSPPLYRLVQVDFAKGVGKCQRYELVNGVEVKVGEPSRSMERCRSQHYVGQYEVGPADIYSVSTEKDEDGFTTKLVCNRIYRMYDTEKGRDGVSRLAVLHRNYDHSVTSNGDFDAVVAEPSVCAAEPRFNVDGELPEDPCTVTSKTVFFPDDDGDPHEGCVVMRMYQQGAVLNAHGLIERRPPALLDEPPFLPHEQDSVAKCRKLESLHLSAVAAGECKGKLSAIPQELADRSGIASFDKAVARLVGGKKLGHGRYSDGDAKHVPASFSAKTIGSDKGTESTPGR